MMNVYESVEHSILAVREQPLSDVKDYGVIDGTLNEDGLHEVRRVVEKPEESNAPSNKTIVGRFVLRPEIFDYIEAVYEKNEEDVPLSDAISMLAHDQLVYGMEFDGKRYDIGSKTGYVKATLDFALKRDEMKQSILEQMSTVVHEHRQNA